MWLTAVTVWLFFREGVAKSPCKCGSRGGIYKDWVARLDDYLRMTDSEVLQNAGKVSHALAEQKAKEEYQKYKRLHSGELSRVEQAFLESVEATAKRLEGK